MRIYLTVKISKNYQSPKISGFSILNVDSVIGSHFSNDIKSYYIDVFLKQHFFKMRIGILAMSGRWLWSYSLA